MEETYAKFRRLDPDKIIDTVRALHAQIEDRFPIQAWAKWWRNCSSLPKKP